MFAGAPAGIKADGDRTTLVVTSSNAPLNELLVYDDTAGALVQRVATGGGAVDAMTGDERRTNQAKQPSVRLSTVRDGCCSQS